jgi:hypothetical protein
MTTLSEVYAYLNIAGGTLFTTMSIVVAEQRLAQRIVAVYPDPTYTSFVAKAQKARTRKGKNYFILRVTIPKEIAEKIEAGPEDYLVLKAKKAEWYHMVNWLEMRSTWKMLPQSIKESVTLSGLPSPDFPKLLVAQSNQDTTWPQLAAATSTDTLMNSTMQVNPVAR